MAIIDKSSNFFKTKLYTGNGSTQNITGLDFAPNWVWIKSRTSSRVHVLVDTVRGATKRLQTNEADAEATTSNSLTAFNSDGFSLGSYNQSNEGSASFVSWNWKAGSSFSNNAGANGATIASTGSVNQDAGFSICSFTGNGTSGATVKHGLSTKPALMIVKNLAEADSWQVYHHKNTSSPATQTLQLNETGATSTTSNRWNDTEPTTSVFTLGNNPTVNKSGVGYIGYIFSEENGFSKFGKYTGNANASGTFVYTGFSPAFVIIKNKDAGESWMMFDNERLSFNQINGRYQLQPNTSGAEYQGAPLIDFLSGGFKLTTNTNSLNVAQDYIYWAFAKNPFVTSTDNNSVPGPAV
tara:strand:- start:38 stop:1096 length:1059 start_codon:yes stop_codon:yes gene_type:complete